MASVPLAIVLVAALVVPLAVIPGTFGFDRWPSSHGERVTERQVRLAPPKVDVVAVRPRRAVPERQPVLVSAAARPAPAVVAVAPAPRRTAGLHVQAPKPDRTPRPSHEPQPQPGPQPQAQQPAPPPSKGDSGLLAGRDTPVAREAPQQEAPAPAPQPAPEPAPQPDPEPVRQPAPEPVERVAAPEPCHGRGHGGGQQGDDDSQQ